MSNSKGHLFFVGIVGHAMRGLALATRELGYEVTGFDPGAEEGAGTEWLAQAGLKWSRQFAPEQLDGVTAVIVTGAHAGPDSAVVTEARHRKIQIKSYAQLVGELTAGERVIAVAGTHGKTTTSALITWLLEAADRHPDYLIGIRPFNFDSSVRMAGGDVAVLEGDEYRASQLETRSKVQYYHPDTLVLTSAEHDHPDLFPDLDAVINRFHEVVAALPPAGQLIAWAESQTVAEITRVAPCEVITYGLQSGGYTARDMAYQPTGVEFDLAKGQEVLGRIAVPLYGRHNVLNTLAAAAAALGEGLTIDQIVAGAAKFKGAYRRFNRLTPADASIAVIDDYAHHPTEAKTTIEAAKLHFPGRRIVVIYRPHTYSRTAALLPEYHHAFEAADIMYVTAIEAARESVGEETVSGDDIVQGLKPPAYYVPDRTDLIHRIQADAQAGDVVLCLTVSGYEAIAEELAKKLNRPAK